MIPAPREREAGERRLWFEKAYRLEEDRLTLLRLLEALAETRLRLNGTAGGLAETPEFRAVERRIMEQLTAVNDRQNAYLAGMMGFAPARDGESGHLGGLAADLAFTRQSETREAKALRGRRLTVVSGSLLADVRRVAEEQGVSVRTWIEGTLKRRLTAQGTLAVGGLVGRVRERLRQGPANCRTLAREFGLAPERVSVALRQLKAHRRARYTGPPGSRHHVWVSLEEE